MKAETDMKYVLKYRFSWTYEEQKGEIITCKSHTSFLK